MRSKRTWLLALVAVAIAVVVAVFLFVGGDDDEDDGTSIDDLPDATLPAPISGDLSAEAQELIMLLDRGEEGRYHAVYDVQGDPAVIGGEMTLELWRDGGRSRRDTHIAAEGSSADTAAIVDDDGRTISCNRFDGAEWTCFEPEETGDPEATTDAGDVIGGVRDQLAGAEVVARDDEIDGRDVRCFELAIDEGQAEVCVDPDGVVIRLASGDTAMVLTELDDVVPGEIFVPPAELTDPPEVPDAPPPEEG